MSEVVLYKNAGEIIRKFFSLLVSMKYHIFVVASIGLFLGIIDGWLWATVVTATVGIRGWEKYIRKPTVDTEVVAEAPPNVQA